jgi:hypothetical protein
MLYRCFDCNQKVSSSATICPNCGNTRIQENIEISQEVNIEIRQETALKELAEIKTKFFLDIDDNFIISILKSNNFNEADSVYSLINKNVNYLTIGYSSLKTSLITDSKILSIKDLKETHEFAKTLNKKTIFDFGSVGELIMYYNRKKGKKNILFGIIIIFIALIPLFKVDISNKENYLSFIFWITLGSFFLLRGFSRMFKKQL